MAWVRIPTLSSLNDTIIFIYYNVPDAPARPSSTVWDSDYEIIYHLNQSTFGKDSTLDSTSNNRHGTPISEDLTNTTVLNSSDIVSTQIGNGLNFDAIINDSSAIQFNYIDIPDLNRDLFASHITFSIWAYADPSYFQSFLFAFTSNKTALILETSFIAKTTTIFQFGDLNQNINDTSAKNSWIYYTIVLDNSSVTLYKNGTPIDSTPNTFVILNDEFDDNSLGGKSSEGRNSIVNFDGQLDEFRFSSTARSANWITTEYNNQFSPNTFYTVSALEARDVNRPNITLNGPSTITLSENAVYTEYGATTNDGSNVTVGGDIVDIRTGGVYIVTYDATSATGVPAIQVTRTITVEDIFLDASWFTRQQIDINSSQIPSNLTNFTVLISMTSSNLNSSAVQSNGNDIRFTTSDGFTLLDHEIESFSNDDTSGSLVAWVGIPTLSNSNDTMIYIYYNVSDVPARPSYSTWDSNYELIYHMNQNTFGKDSTLDSTSNNRHATPMDDGNTTFDSSDSVSAQIGNGLDFDGVDKDNSAYLDLPDLESSLFMESGYTISLWANAHTRSQHFIISDFSTANSSDSHRIHLALGDRKFLFNVFITPNTFKSNHDINAISLNTWYYYTVIVSSTSNTIYLNAQNISTVNVNNTYHTFRTDNFIGNSLSYSNTYLDAQMDEYRLSSIARSVDWITTEYNNQLSPDTFYTVLPQETRDVTPPLITLNGSNASALQVGATYTELGATSSDNSTVTIGGDVVDTSITGTYIVTYDATNAIQIPAIQVIRTITVQYFGPIITLLGDNPQLIELGSSYNELGATTDDTSQVIINISSVNTNQIGNYTVTYDATNTAGNAAIQVNRTVIVQDTVAPIIVGNPVFDIQTSNLTISFSENVNISSDGLLLGGNNYTFVIDYSNNLTLVLSFGSDAVDYLANPATPSSEYYISVVSPNAIQDNAGNNISITNIPLNVHNNISANNYVINSSLVRIEIPILLDSTHQNVTISYSPTTDTTATIFGGLYAKLVSESIIIITIPSSTIITHDGSWDSSFILPRTTTTLAVPTTTEGRTTTTYEPIISITLGSTDTSLDLNSTATILFENHGGNNYDVYYINPSDSTPNPILSCGTSNTTEINTSLATIGECFIDDNTDITIYTTHLSTYGLVSTSASTTSGGILAPVSVSGGGGGGSSGGGVGSIYTGGASPLTVKAILYKVSWETSDNKKLIEIIAGPSSDNAFVTLISTKLGTVTAEPSITQPYSDRVVYLGIVDSSETFVQVRAGVYTNALFDSKIKLVDISQPTGSITFDSTSSVETVMGDKTMTDDKTADDKTMTDDTADDKT